MTLSPWFIASPFVCTNSQLSFPVRIWHRKLPRVTCPFWPPRSHTGLLRTQPPLRRSRTGHAFPDSWLVCMKMTLFQWVHLPNKLHYSVLPLSIAIIHQTCFIYTFRQWWVMLSSASLSKRQAELASPFPSFEGKGHQVYFFENAVSTYHVAETLL